MLSQKDILKGKIVVKSIEGFAVNIYNLNQQKGTINDVNGNFEISARVNDTIVFSSIQYKELRIVIKDSHFLKEQLEINLQEELHKLSEVLVSKSGLTGNLLMDVNNIPVKKSYSNDFFGLPLQNKKPLTIPERNLRAAKTGAVNTIVNSLNGKIKKMRFAVEMEKEISLVEKASEMFDRSMFSEELGLPEDEVKRFLFYCTDDIMMKHLVNEEKVLELMSFFKEKVIKFKKGRKE